MIFVFDVGNTNTVLGVYDGEELTHHWRIETNRNKTNDEYGMLIKSLFDFARFVLIRYKWHYYFLSCTSDHVCFGKDVYKIF